MFAIKINSETLDIIKDSLDEDSEYKDTIEYFARMENRWYFLRGYTAPRGAFYPEMVMPGFIIETQFEYDPQKIDHDWDQIVRL